MSMFESQKAAAFYMLLLMFVMFMGVILGIIVGESGGSVTRLPGPWEHIFEEGYEPHDFTVEHVSCDNKHPHLKVMEE